MAPRAAPAGEHNHKGPGYASVARRRARAAIRFAQDVALADPSTMPFLRAYSIGFTASFAPVLIKILIGLTVPRSPRSSQRRGAVLAPHASKLSVAAFQLRRALEDSLSPRGLALAFGIAVGGGKWLESRVEPVVRVLYWAWRVRIKTFIRRVFSRESAARRRRAISDADPETLSAIKRRKHEAFIKIMSTWVGSTIASFISISLLQTKVKQHRAQLPPATAMEQPGLDVGFSPYPGVGGAATSSVAPHPTSTTVDSAKSLAFPPRMSHVTESPTLDLTLFMFVRASDVFVRFIYEISAVATGRWGRFVEFFADRGDAWVFWLSCWRIMHCWFYAPHRLPPSYNRWILALARMNPGLLRLLQFARNNEYVYGQKPNAEVMAMCVNLAKGYGRDVREVSPEHIKRLDCSFVHGKIGAGPCEVNAIMRFLYAFRDCMFIYLPVHAVPQLLFNWKNIVKNPTSSAIRVLTGASRSSAFLATFVASIYAAVCLVRTRLPLVLPNVPQQFWDSGACVGLGCFVCGLSVLIENKRRRKEMALYVAPRALYATMEEIVPGFLQNGKVGQFMTYYIERAVFAASTGTVIAAMVHRPDLVSGVVRGVAGLAVGNWGGDAVVQTKKGENDKPRETSAGLQAPAALLNYDPIQHFQLRTKDNSYKLLHANKIMRWTTLAAASATLGYAAQIPFSSRTDLVDRLSAESSAGHIDDGSFTTLTHPDFQHHAVRVRNTTGWCEEKAQSMTGYIDAHGRSLFFYFFASRSNPDKDDVLLWTNGGPGGSSALGLFMENGPCTVSSDGNSTKSNPHSWNDAANVIFIDQPAGVGFSHSGSGVTVSTTEQAAIDIHAFLTIFFEAFSSYKGRGLHLSGESYGGRYLPVFASRIVHENEKLVKSSSKRAPLNLKSVLIGNGLTDTGSMLDSYYAQSCTSNNGVGRPVLGIRTCIQMQPEVKRCDAWFKRSCRDHDSQPECDVAAAYCAQVIETPFLAAGLNPYDISKACDTLDEDLCYPESRAITSYLNREWVRTKLGVDRDVGNFSTISWKVWQRFNQARVDELEPTFFHLTGLLERDISVLIYVGKHDWICNYIGNFNMLEQLEWSGQKRYVNTTLRKWSGFEGSAGGETKTFGKLTYLDLNGAGHMVPYDKPREALYMLKKWLKGEEF
ncbi:hypothetical protein OIV83_000786 [Microbotryomycetes sp. JL201]|nr:hypothetical protein OIV83_000786 [Microbotryomycetes sp. JL201]